MPDNYRTSATVAIATLTGVSAIIVVALLTNIRVGVVLLAVFALAGAGARIVAPVSAAFAVRRRAIDVTVLVVFAVALGYLSFTAPLT